MLSDSIDTLAAGLRFGTASPAPALLADLLDDLADQARGLEGRAIPTAFRLHTAEAPLGLVLPFILPRAANAAR